MDYKKRNFRIKKSMFFIVTFLLVFVLFFSFKSPYQKLRTIKTPKPTYDVIVAGTDPEGVMAAISAARNGLSVLLLDGNNRKILGGLMTLGWLNSIDMNYTKKDPDLLEKKPDRLDYFNKGLFKEWFDQIEGDSFDVNTATDVFHRMVNNEQNIDTLMLTQSFKPIVTDNKITGMSIKLANDNIVDVSAYSVIDATQDADVAAAAGVPYTEGMEDLGRKKDERMVSTAIFRLTGFNEEDWKKLTEFLETDDDPASDANNVSAWGFTDVKNYVPKTSDRIRMRGLNVGREKDNSILINSMHIFDIDPLDPNSKKEALELAKKEMPHILEYIKKVYPVFEHITSYEIAPELYIRESRHIQGEYRLNIVDVLENRDRWDRVAFGSYAVDIQRIDKDTAGIILGKPTQYAIPFQCLVPLKIDGLLVVGRSASFDTLAHGSARVIPTGMATGEAAGAAAQLVLDKQISFRSLSHNEAYIKELQAKLTRQGMKLNPFSPDTPSFQISPYYPALKSLLFFGLVNGSYNNDFEYGSFAKPLAIINMLNRLSSVYSTKLQVIPYEPTEDMPDKELFKQELLQKNVLSLDLACYYMAKNVGVKASRETALKKMLELGYIHQDLVDSIKDKKRMIRGEVYEIVNSLLEKIDNKIHSS